MNKRMLLGLAVVLAGTAVRAQDLSRFYGRPSGPSTGSAKTLREVYTRPALPTRLALDRLNLRMGWYAYVPTGGLRDGLFSVQVFPDMVLVQTRSGILTALDPLDGSTLWRASPGATTYRTIYPVAINQRSVFVFRGVTLFALNRLTGQRQWEHLLPTAPSAPPAADEDRLYLCLGTSRMFAYEIPKLAVKPAEGADESALPYEERFYTYVGERGTPAVRVGPRPITVFDYKASTGLEQTPVVTSNLVILAGNDGSFFGISKFARQLQYQFQAMETLSAPMGQHGEMAYIASQDFKLYALDTPRGLLPWRFTGAAPIIDKPEVTDEDVYLAPEGAGLYRLDRATGQERWVNERGLPNPNRKATRFVAANKKFVYAQDRGARLLILDRATGRDLATLDTREYVFPVSNEWTDRVYLAANNGLVVCLHDRDHPTPLAMKTVSVQEDTGGAGQQPGEGKGPAIAPAAGGGAEAGVGR